MDTLEGDGPFTVFGPTDRAFEALAKMLGVTIAELLELPNLADILTYHVAAGKVLAEDLMDGEKIMTVEGADVVIALNEQGAFVNRIQITKTDLLASNGVVHIINGVLLPPSSELTALVEASGTVVDVALRNGLNDLGAALTKVTLVPMVTSACQPLLTYRLKLLETITLYRLSLWTLSRAMVHSPSSALRTRPLRPWPRCLVSRSPSSWSCPTWLTSSRTTSLPERSWQRTSWTERGS